jgi:hypothetical protein
MTNSRLRSSRAASTKDARITEMMNGLLISKLTVKKEPVVIDLQEYARSAAAPVQGINKLMEIHVFINSNGRV